METVNVTLSNEQLAKLIDAYKTLQDFLGVVLPPNEIYTEEFLAGPARIPRRPRQQLRDRGGSFDDFTSASLR